jgi:hypothetical protein
MESIGGYRETDNSRTEKRMAEDSTGLIGPFTGNIVFVSLDYIVRGNGTATLPKDKWTFRTILL